MPSASGLESADCAICGKVVAPADLAPEIARQPRSARLTVHARCFETYLEHSRARGEVWARSPRGRRTLLWLRLRFGVVAAVGVFATIVAAAPIAVALAARGWRLRRAVHSRFLDGSRAVAIVGCFGSRAESAEVRDVFSATWAAAAGVTVLVVEVDAPFAKTELARAAWEHWGSSGKPPRQASVVLVPRRGRVCCLPLVRSSTDADPSASGRLAAVRTTIESLLSNEDAKG